jgi:CDP-paratose 2-epimerase
MNTVEMNSRRALITGGAGFIGSNLAARLLDDGATVTVFDNLSRRGARHNFHWLSTHRHASSLRFVHDDVRNARAVADAVRGQTEIYHLAAQVAVTTSVENPRLDFEVNAAGTFNVLEAARASSLKPFLLFTSTNKVYGSIPDESTGEHPLRYQLREYPNGIDEKRPLDFHSPYGCSKGAADQYVRDYARVYGLPTVVFRMSCIYGPHQFGTEDQGWLAHFAISALLNRPIWIYGDGRQVRDALFVDDLVDAMQAAYRNVDRTAGHAYNIGGGRRNAVSLLELVALLEDISGRRVALEYGRWRVGDQKAYISDIRRFAQDTGWTPQTKVADGVRRLYTWLQTQLQRLGKVTAETEALAG